MNKETLVKQPKSSFCGGEVPCSGNAGDRRFENGRGSSAGAVPLPVLRLVTADGGDYSLDIEGTEHVVRRGGRLAAVR